MDAEAILSGPEYFTCNRHACKMKKGVCLAKQRQLAEMREELEGTARDTLNVRLNKCFKCDQGQKIKEETMEDQAVYQEKKEPEKMCKKCGKNPTKMRNGLCGKCHGEVIQSGKKAKKEAKTEATPAEVQKPIPAVSDLLFKVSATKNLLMQARQTLIAEIDKIDKAIEIFKE